MRPFPYTWAHRRRCNRHGRESMPHLALLSSRKWVTGITMTVINANSVQSHLLQEVQVNHTWERHATITLVKQSSLWGSNMLGYGTDRLVLVSLKTPDFEWNSCCVEASVCWMYCTDVCLPSINMMMCLWSRQMSCGGFTCCVAHIADGQTAWPNTLHATCVWSFHARRPIQNHRKLVQMANFLSTPEDNLQVLLIH